MSSPGSLVELLRRYHSASGRNPSANEARLINQMTNPQIVNHVWKMLNELQDTQKQTNQNDGSQGSQPVDSQEGDEGYDVQEEEQDGHQQQDDQEADDLQQMDQIQEQQENSQELKQAKDGQQEQDELIPDNSSDDLGLYGDKLDSEDGEEYQDVLKQDDQDLDDQNIIGRRDEFMEQQEEEEEGEDDKHQDDDHVNSQFDHFREIQLQNSKGKEQTQQTGKDTQQQDKRVSNHPDPHVAQLQSKLMAPAEWIMKGQVKSRDRPVNSLLEHSLDFQIGQKLSHQMVVTEEYNQTLEDIIKGRIKDDLWDDRVRFIRELHERSSKKLQDVSTEKSKMGLAELYETEFKNYLGLGENKQDKLKKEILEAMKGVQLALDELGGIYRGKQSVTIREVNQMPLPSLINTIPSTAITHQPQPLTSTKEENSHGKRLKNKRIHRQRMKEQLQKKMNKIIEYGGQTKFLAQAAKKALMNEKAGRKTQKEQDPESGDANVKFSSSGQFFKKLAGMGTSMKHTKPIKK